MLDHESRELAIELAEHHQVAFAHLIEHGNGVPLCVIGLAMGLDGAHVRHIASVADAHVMKVVADVFDKTTVADGHIAQCGIVDAAVFHEALSDLNGPLAIAQTDPAVKLDTVAS